MDRKKLLIAEGTEDFRAALTDSLRGAFHLRECGDGNLAMEMLRRFQPDILVLDLMLPGLDGISLLQMAAAASIRPMVLATTRFVSDYVLEAIDRLGIEYLMVKPCDVRATVARIGDLSRRVCEPRPASKPEPATYVTNLLLTLGIPTKLKGYSYLREAVVQMAKDPTQSITKELYPAVAQVCGGNASHVERSMRNAIQAAWTRADKRVWSMYFAPDSTGTIPRPTNAAFISRLADCLKLDCESA